MSGIFEDRTMLIIYGFGLVFFILRVEAMMNGTWEEITSQPEFQKSIAMVQPFLELIIVVSFIMDVIPRWLGKLRQTEPVKLLAMACSIGGIMLLVYMIPEFITDVSYGEQRLVFTLIIGVSLVTVHVISYWYGKKYKSDKKEEGVENNEDDTE